MLLIFTIIFSEKLFRLEYFCCQKKSVLQNDLSPQRKDFEFQQKRLSLSRVVSLFIFFRVLFVLYELFVNIDKRHKTVNCNDKMFSLTQMPKKSSTKQFYRSVYFQATIY